MQKTGKRGQGKTLPHKRKKFGLWDERLPRNDDKGH